MIRIFRFEKWFFDIVTPEKDYIIIYYTITRFFLFRISYLELHMSPGDNSILLKNKFSRHSKMRIASRNGHSVRSNRGEFIFDHKECSIDLEWEDFKIRLHIDSGQLNDEKWPYLIIRSSLGQYLQWSPIFLKGTVSGKIDTDRRIDIDQCEGYADYLVSHYIPANVPVHELYWGRLHHERMDFTFSLAENERLGKKWYIMIISCDNTVIHLNDITVEVESWTYSESMGIKFPDNYSMIARSEQVDLNLKITQKRSAIESRFLENLDRLGKFPKKVLKVLSKDPRGIKFISSVKGRVSLEGKVITLEDDFLISEYVVFSN